MVMDTRSLDDARRCDRVFVKASRAIACATPAEVVHETHLDKAFSRRAQRLSNSVVSARDSHHTR